MGSLLRNIIQERQGQDVFDKVEKLRHLAKVSTYMDESSTDVGCSGLCCTPP
jgi:phosphoenolpyruvate carboxylase